MLRLILLFSIAIPLFSLPPAEAHIPLPADLSGTLSGANYHIRVPSNWNGVLLVFAHGTQQQPGAAEIAPVAWPPVEPPLEEQLLLLGYALAGSGSENSPRNAVQRNVALANFFRGEVGSPNRVIVWGNSFGGLVTLKLMEDHPGIFDAGIANCAPSAGTPENMDWALAFGLAYATAFDWQDDRWGPIEDLRDNLDFFSDVRPFVPWPPANFGRWEFIRLVMHLEPLAFWGADPQTNGYFFGLGMWKATQQRAAREAEYGGPVAENAGIEYTLTDADIAYLNSLGVGAEGLLSAMNSRTNITAERSARNHAEQWGGLTGVLDHPVLTMHSIYDGLAAVHGEGAYAEVVNAAGSGDKLVQAFVTSVGHCSFSGAQYLSMVSAMEGWLDSGVPPDSSVLTASDGFNLDYVPPPWPF